MLTAGQAAAVPVTWTLDGVTFDHGYVMNGSFTYDADTDTYSDISIGSYTGENDTFYDYWNSYYGSPPVSGPDATAPLFNYSDTGMTLARGYIDFASIQQDELTLVFEEALTNAGGTVALVPNVSISWHYVDVADYYDSSYIVSGVVTAVPVPAAAWLFGSALAGLGWMRRKETV